MTVRGGLLARIVALGLAAAGALVAVAVARLPAVADVAPVAPSDGRPRVRLALHVHSVYSDGAAAPSAIAAAARRARLDVVVLTDHRSLEALDEEGYRDGVLVLAGTEISTEAGHLLALDIPEPAFHFGTDPREVLRDVAELGGLALVAHPLSARPGFAWRDWDAPGYAGLEIVNLDSGGRRRGPVELFAAALAYPWDPVRALASVLDGDPRVLALWDRLAARRRLAGWAGSDAHGRLALGGGRSLPWPGYEATFGVVTNYLLPEAPLRGDAMEDRRLVYDALRDGRGYVAFDGLAPGGSFSFLVRAGARAVGPGEALAWTGSTERLEALVTVAAPPGTTLRLVRDGRPVARTEGGRLVHRIDAPGAYRAEADLAAPFAGSDRAAPWIVSNPVWVLPEAELGALAGPSVPAAPEPVARDCEPPVAPFVFRAEHDPASRVDEEALRAAGGAAVLDFRLAPPSPPERPYVWCALADRTPRSFAGYAALRFRVRADDAYRVAVQLRDPNPEASEEGTEWWATTFKTRAGEREVVLPFERFGSLGPRTDGRLDLDELRGLFFVLDAGTTRPGVAGRIVIDELALCRSVGESPTSPR